MKFNVKGGNQGAEIRVEEMTESEITYLKVHVNLPKTEVPEQFRIEWETPVIECYSVWCSNFDGGKSLRPNWGSRKTNSRLASGLPVHQILSADGRNRICIALSDAGIPTQISTGVIEENACFQCRVSFFTQPTTPIKEYTASIRLDMRDIPYYDSIYDVTDWWEKDCGYTPAYVPKAAKMPMDSLWYSFHQELDAGEILEECKNSKELGMDTVIIDDGWQTDDSNRGYSYCGDWQVAPKKMGDMAELVKQIHALDMKVMLWYSVPFVGIHSKQYETFKGMYLDEGIEKDTYTLDPRYKKVREHLVSVYADAVQNWGLDGLKLDFIDSFVLMPKSMEYDENRDYVSLEEAVDVLMVAVKEELLKINPEILIEFRQSYIGPSIRKYGNIIRVADCPDDALLNRKNIVDLRYTSGKTAVHSDMLMWNKNEPVESAALQFVSILYGVPQVSVKIKELTEQHKKMLAYYLSFWRKYREVLTEGKVIGENPESDYSQVYAVLDDCSIFTAYTDSVIFVKTEKAVVVNGTRNNSLILKNCKGKTCKVVNCLGEELAQGMIENYLEEINVPMSGMVFIE